MQLISATVPKCLPLAVWAEPLHRVSEGRSCSLEDRQSLRLFSSLGHIYEERKAGDGFTNQQEPFSLVSFVRVTTLPALGLLCCILLILFRAFVQFGFYTSAY